jgi:hypothetical protein
VSGTVARRGGAAVTLANHCGGRRLLIEIRASSFCTTIAETPGMPAKIKREKQYSPQE